MKKSAKNLATTTVFASLYFVLVYLFQPISFLQIQVRVADALNPLVALFGLPAVFGLILGVFIANISSPLGWIDLVSVLPSLAGLLIIRYLANKYTANDRGLLFGIFFNNTILSFWISWMLCYVFMLPTIEQVAIFLYVFIGLGISHCVLGYPLYKAIKTRLFKK